MPTLLIRLEYPPPGEQLVIRGYRIQHGEGSWHEDVGPVRELPRGLPTVSIAVGIRPLEELAREALLATGDPPLPVDDVGRRLWHLIADGEIGSWWADEIKAAGAAPVRTLLDIRPPELETLPWELMTTDRGTSLFRDASHPWVRANPNWPPLEELLAPVDVLIVIGETQAEDLDVEHELEAIHRCLREKPGSWHVEVVWAPKRETLRQMYKKVRPHILHVIGHAAKRNGQYVLSMVPPNSEPWPLTVEYARSLPAGAPISVNEDVAELPIPAPRLVELNCCRTSLGGAAAEPAWTFTDAFLEQGSAAVVTVQGDIPSSASVAFTSEFYGRLVAGQAIDAAAAGVRLRVSDVMQARQRGVRVRRQSAHYRARDLTGRVLKRARQIQQSGTRFRGGGSTCNAAAVSAADAVEGEELYELLSAG